MNFEFCRKMYKYAITINYVVICKKKKYLPLVSNYYDQLLWFVKNINKNPKNMKRKNIQLHVIYFTETDHLIIVLFFLFILFHFFNAYFKFFL